MKSVLSTSYLEVSGFLQFAVARGVQTAMYMRILALVTSFIHSALPLPFVIERTHQPSEFTYCVNDGFHCINACMLAYSLASKAGENLTALRLRISAPYPKI